MRSLRDLPTVRRLNAPTRAAAARRRRLRKGGAAALVALATLIVLAPRSGSSAADPPTRRISTAQLHGRHLMSIPADASLISSLEGDSRVDVWNNQGKPLARSVPAIAPPSENAMAGAKDKVLVALDSAQVARVAAARDNRNSDSPEIIVTISP